jgi:hypothetical protein
MAGIKNEHGLTVFQENYCVAFIDINNATAAYRNVYDCSNSLESTVNENASRLHSNPKVIARIDALRAPVIAKVLAKYEFTLDGLLVALSETRGVALGAETPQSSAAVAATMGMAKLLGLVSDRVAVDATMSLGSLIREIEAESS